ncbi:hypothetical protein LBMAG54_05280 [Nitrosopumilaceae archaeon]|nr:hypothetical protein EMGBD3_00820 [Nitrosarchaeum sp.]GDY15672.1 hypothetical protein LBMAG54_05280 [Nitrosopumilaceae archaeon]
MKPITLLHESYERAESLTLTTFFPRIIPEFEDNDEQMMDLLRSESIILQINKNIFEDVK